MCNVAQMANGIIVWLIGFIFIIFMVIMVMAGVGLVTSGGNHHALDEAKNRFVKAIVGLLIILSAWLIVDTIMRGLVGKDGHEGEIQAEGSVNGWLFWSEVQCYEQTKPNDFEAYMPDELNLIAPDKIDNVSTIQPGGTYMPSSDVPPDSAFSYQPGISAQSSHTSPELQMLLNCMLSQIPGNVGEISSISDSNIVSGNKTWQQCWDGQCEHTDGSCHYGNGYGVVGQSYAVDFGDETNSSDLVGAAYACGAGYAGIHNGNHVHVSAAACKGN